MRYSIQMTDSMSKPATYQFDELEEQMIEALKQDPLISTQALADSLSVTRSQINTRLRRIEDNEAAHVLTQINAAAGGYRLMQAYLKVQSSEINKVASKLGSIPEIVFVCGVLGEVDLFVSIRIHESQPIARLYNEIAKCDGIFSLELESILEIFAFRSNWISFSRALENVSLKDRKADLRRDLSELSLDELDVSIIAELLEDGRRNVRTVARSNDITDGTVRYRLNALRTQNLLSTTTVVDPSTAELSTWAFISVSVEPSYTDQLVDEVNSKKWLEVLHMTTGRSCISCAVVTKDQRELNSIVSWLRTMPGVINVAPLIATDIYFLDRRWFNPIGPV